MKGSAGIYGPLFPEEPDVWKSLDSQTRQEVVEMIARMLAMHIEQSVTDETQQEGK